MARYLESSCRLCRRENQKLFLKGDRCLSEKCSIERRGYPPGQHGQGRIKFSEFGLQLREKQKIKRLYGLLESQFRSTFERASRMKGITGSNLVTLLERRLDNVVYRLGMAGSRQDARQLVLHKHVTVDGRVVNIPSFSVSKGDVIEVAVKSKPITRVQVALEGLKRREIPQWLEMNSSDVKGRVRDLPARDDVTTQMEERLIVELYSK